MTFINPYCKKNENRPTILFVINNLEFLYSHRLPIVLGAVAQGYDVHVATYFKGGSPLKHQDQLTYHYIDFNRSSINPFIEIKSLLQLVFLYRRLQPKLIHHMCKKSGLYGCMVTRFLKKIPVVNTVPGLGYLFIHDSFKANVVKGILYRMYRFGLKRADLRTVFQNDDDQDLFLQRQLIRSEQCVMIRGSGVDVDVFFPRQQPNQKNERPLVVLPARLLWDKGVGEFVEAARRLHAEVSARFALVGDVDPMNPASVTMAEIQAWVSQGYIEYWGWRDDMVSVFQQADIVCLPSYREGMPKALLEAAACGLPIVTTDAPGCKDVIVHGESGFIVPIKESVLLSHYLRQLIDDPDLRETMGLAGRHRVIQRFSTKVVILAHLNLYQGFLNTQASLI